MKSKLTRETLAPAKAKLNDLLANDRSLLINRMPFIGGLLMRLDLVPVWDERLETASTDGDHVFVDVEFYAGLGKAERLFVLAHEAWHCALLHFLRRGGRDRDRFNVAADLEIHFLLTAEGMHAPFVLPHNPQWKGLSAEEIYEQLPKKLSRLPALFPVVNRGAQGLRSDMANGKGFDEHIDQDSGKGNVQPKEGRAGIGWDPDYTPRISSGTAERCRERMTAAVQQYQRTRGDLPDGVSSVVNAVLKPEMDWREILAQFVTSCYGGSRRWLPPARRHVWKGLYLPSQRSEKLKAVVAIDTSGSTSQDLPRFFGELNGILNSFGGYELTVIHCDCEIAKVEKFDEIHPVDPNSEWRAYGNGGTRFTPVFDYVENNMEETPSLLVYFTDGFGDDPQRMPPYPVLWVVTSDGAEPARWGTKVRFKK